MLSYWSDFDRTVSMMDQFRQRMERLLGELDFGRGGAERGPILAASWPRANLHDAGENLVLAVELPGLTDKDLQITANQDSMTLTGDRTVQPPQGYSVHRKERPSMHFSRSFAFPCKVDADKASAKLANGVLTITVPKAPEAQPRRIAVQAS